MKALAICLALTACAADPLAIDPESSADAGVATIKQPVVLDAELNVLFGINYDFWDNALAGYVDHEGPVVPPVADWICPPFNATIAMVPPGGGPPQVYYGDQTLSGPTARFLESSNGCGGTLFTKRCEYKFNKMRVSSSADVVVYMTQMKPCGHGGPNFGKQFAPPPPGTWRTAYINYQGPYGDKAYWKGQICDSGCYACGPEWYANNTSMRHKVCTWNGQACVAPCRIDSTSW